MRRMSSVMISMIIEKQNDSSTFSCVVLYINPVSTVSLCIYSQCTNISHFNS